ncbi:ABC transporter G family member 37-like [Camellia sinensis]|uniref:ABC transporter G family member 37-like n=1 Tax=Camellia sinensis TaxID=4442 RepID=UPI001035E217|nr:ABC transporter G family member 37-like [Camellia sinensis]XP_028054683.1 ABC transporter G family member 37-like [Camellia sinensis]
MPTWLKWGFWVSPLTYGELGLALNEFLAPRWQKEVRERGFTQKKLRDITGAFRPGVLTALMGVSGVVKTTLMDVLAGRKTSGTIEGDIRIGGFPKVHDTFARISGYCEQTKIHSPQITVEGSVVYSVWLRLCPEIDSKTKFV